jgi:hypothetical protein
LEPRLLVMTMLLLLLLLMMMMLMIVIHPPADKPRVVTAVPAGPWESAPGFVPIWRRSGWPGAVD